MAKRYQRVNQNPYIEEEQTTQWPKEKVQKDKQRSTKHTYKTKDRVTRTPLKIYSEIFVHFYFTNVVLSIHIVLLAWFPPVAMVPSYWYIVYVCWLFINAVNWFFYDWLVLFCLFVIRYPQTFLEICRVALYFVSLCYYCAVLSIRIVMKFVSDFRQVGGFLRLLLFPPPIKLTPTI